METTDVDGKRFPPWSESNHEDIKYYESSTTIFDDSTFKYDLEKLKAIHGQAYVKNIRDMPGAKIFDKSFGSKTLAS